MERAAGQRLRQLRAAAGLRQVDVAGVLGISRTTLANIEAGREGISRRVSSAIVQHFPPWGAQLFPAGTCSSAGDAGNAVAVPGGPFVLEEVTISYLFGESAAPSEVVEARRVRATRAGAAGYLLSTARTDPVEYQVESEPLWGGYIAEETVPRDQGGDPLEVRRVFQFGRQLRRGERHSFAVRSWVERDPDPDTCIVVNFTIPTETVGLHLTCLGSRQLAAVWAFGPVGIDEGVSESDPAAWALTVSDGGTVGVQFARPRLGPFYGVGWRWRT